MHHLKLIALLACVLLPGSAAAANKEHEAIQRDISMIGEDLRKLQASLTNEFTAMKTMVQQSINASDKAQNSVLVLETRMTERMQALEKSLGQTVANMNAKVDSMADEFRAIKEESKETNARLMKMSTKMDELKILLQLMKSEPAPPQPAGGVTAPPQAATDYGRLFEDADRDRLAGKTDLAIKEYREFVKTAPKNDRACEAQFRVGELLMKKDDIPNAAAEFDMVIERYDSTCTFQAAARYMKGKAFVKAGQPNAAKDEFRRLVEDYKGTEWETKAKEALKEIGFSAAAPNKGGTKKTRR
jgi:TolA-binding protein